MRWCLLQQQAKGGAAEQCGVPLGCTLVSIGGAPVETLGEANFALERAPHGQELDFIFKVVAAAASSSPHEAEPPATVSDGHHSAWRCVWHGWQQCVWWPCCDCVNGAGTRARSCVCVCLRP